MRREIRLVKQLPSRPFMGGPFGDENGLETRAVRAATEGFWRELKHEGTNHGRDTRVL